MPTLAVIPARYASSRFPGKPLAPIAGKPMIQRVYEQVAKAERFDEIVVATDDRRIYECVETFGGQAVMTRDDHPTGTDRIAEAASHSTADLIVNIQGDEPLMPPGVLDELVSCMRDNPDVAMGTVAVPFDADSGDFVDPNVVQVVLDQRRRALYFSRAAIPFARDSRPTEAQPLRHWGVYAYRRDFLYDFVSWPQSPLERCEQLEQLRALEHGASIYVLISHARSIGVDVQADVARVEAILAQEGQA